MSSIVEPQASTQAEVKRQLEAITDPHERSRQALGDPTARNHNDGEYLHKHFNVPPLHKYLGKQEARAAERGEEPPSVVRFPRAFVDSILYTDERDLKLIRQLAAQDLVDYDFRDPHPSHEALERYPPLRAKMIEWVADDPKRAKALRSVKGTDMWAIGEPGGGKTTLGLSAALWRMEINNETFIWGESVDESGTNDRLEWLSFAPFATLAVPADLGVRVRIVPKHVGVEEFEVALEDICRDVIYYESVDGLLEQLQPGQFYVVYPDPLHRGCDAASRFNYFNFREVTDNGEPGPNEPTKADHWWFAFIARRISADKFVHPTFINFDEAQKVLDADARKDIHQHYEKVKWYRDKYADARKKGVSFGYQTHSLSDIHRFGREKIRWRITMAGNAPPIGRRLPGDRYCPIEQKVYTTNMDPGYAAIWKGEHFAKLRWPELKAKARLDAEVSIDFTRWQEATGGVA